MSRANAKHANDTQSNFQFTHSQKCRHEYRHTLINYSVVPVARKVEQVARSYYALIRPLGTREVGVDALEPLCGRRVDVVVRWLGRVEQPPLRSVQDLREAVVVEVERHSAAIGGDAK